MSEEVAAAIGDIAYWKERAAQAEAKVEGLNLAADQYSESRDQWMLKAKAAEADAASLHTLLDDAITLCHIPEHNQDAQWYARFEAIILAFHEEHTGAQLLAENAEIRRALDVAMAENEQRMLVERALRTELEAARQVLTVARKCLAALPSSPSMHDRLCALSQAIHAYNRTPRAPAPPEWWWT